MVDQGQQRSLSKYTLLRELGRGAYGMVYLARDTVLEVERAVKVLHPQLMVDGALVERFRREAQLAARLEHPHIVPVYDFGEEEGHFYLAMRYMPGVSLKERLEERGALPWAEALRIARQVAEGLVYAHERGVVHRDLKPGNILFDDQGNAAIADFGFAKAVSGGASSMSLTATGGMIGTPPYMAPELWKNKDVGPAVDQYALACIVAEMLTGEVLFGGDTPWEVIEKHKEGPQFPERWPEGVPAGVEAVLRKALAEAPDERCEDALAFVGALEACQAKAEVEAAALQETEEARVKATKTLAEAGEQVEEAASSRKGARPAAFLPKGSTRRLKALWGGLALALVIALVVGLLVARHGSEEASSGASIVLPPTLVSPGTPLPSGLVLITASNVAKARQLTRWGTGEMYAVAWSPDSKLLAVASPIGIYLCDAASGKQMAFLGIGAFTTSVAFSPDGTLLASGSSDKTVRLWRVSDEVLVRKLEGHRGWVESVAFSSDGTLLASGSSDKTVRLWRVSDGALVRTLKGHADEVNSVVFSPDGTLLASGSRDGTVRVWRVSDGALVQTLEGHTGHVFSVAFSPDGSLLASGSDDMVQLWRVADGALVWTRVGHTNYVLSVAFSLDGTLLASGSSDGTVGLWRVSDGTLVRRLVGRLRDVDSVVFSPDGTLLALASGSVGGAVLLWGVP